MPSPLDVTRPLAVPLRRAGVAGRVVFLALLPQGGQLASRRNAWSAMTVDAGRARARREAASAFAAMPPRLVQHRYGQQQTGR